MPTRLYAKQTAGLNKCGSCGLFKRWPNDPNYLDQAPVDGNCGLKMPPWIKLRHTHARPHNLNDEYIGREGCEVVNNSSDWTRVEDTDACSFWRAADITFVKDQEWGWGSGS